MDQAVQQAWRYAVDQAASFEELNEILQRRGADGWELVNIVHNTAKDLNRPLKVRREQHAEDWYAFFKQPV